MGNLNNHHVTAKSVPQPLTLDQKGLDPCLVFREMANDDPIFISRIIISDGIRADLVPLVTSKNFPDFALFPKMKLRLKGEYFVTANEIQTESLAPLASSVLLRVGEAMRSLCTVLKGLFRRGWRQHFRKVSLYPFFF